MDSLNGALEPILMALGAITVTIIIPAGVARLRRRRPSPPPNPAAQQPKRETSGAMRITVALYSILAIVFWYTSQPDLFTRLRLPITATGDQIRSALVTQRPTEFIPLELQKAYEHASANGVNIRRETRTSHPLFTPELDRVLQRIETFDVRIMYGRLGHAVVASCDWCTTQEDYLVFGAAGLALAYVALLAIVGVVTEAPERRKSRVYAVVGVAVAAAVDVACTGLVKGTLRRGDHVQYHVRAERLRLVLHIFLPNMLLMLPHNAPYLTQQTYMHTIQALAALSHVSSAQQSTIKNTRYAGLVRDASISSWAEATMRNVDNALEDEDFKARLELTRAEEKDGQPAVERLKTWAGKAVAEALGDMTGMIANRGQTPGPE